MIETTKYVIKAGIFTLIFILTASVMAAVNKDITILTADADRLVFEYKPGDIEWNEIDINGRTFDQLYMYQGLTSDSVGVPAVPFRQVRLGIPENGNINVQLMDVETVSLTDKELAPVPAYETDESGEFYPVYASIVTPIREPYVPVQLKGTHIFRKQRVATLNINPVEYFPGSRQVRLHTRMRIVITFPSSANVATTVRTGADESAYRTGLINYEQAKKWRISSPQALYKRQSVMFSGDNWYKISIKGNGTTMERGSAGNEEGMYKITGSTLKEAGVNISAIDPATLQIFNNGGVELPKEINDSNPPDSLMENAIRVVGGSDGSFDDNDYILFYGRPLDWPEWSAEKERLVHIYNHFDDTNVYWLTWGKAEGKRMAARPSLSMDGAAMQASFRDLAYFEREEFNVYHSGIHWYDRSMSSTNTSRSYTLDLNDVVPDSITDVRVALALLSTGQQDFNIRVNGNNVGSPSYRWGGFHIYRILDTHWTNYGVLRNGTNTVTIHYLNTAETDIAYVDFIEVMYHRQFKALDDQLMFWGPSDTLKAGFQVTGFSATPEVYDVSDFDNVTQISGSTGSGQITFADDSPGYFAKKYIAVTPGAYKSIDADAITQAELQNLRVPKQVDYIIITYDDFAQQAHELESLRENWNMDDRLETEVVNMSQVRDQFGFGINDPGAIRDFLYYARNNWGDPYYVLLFGDGSFNYKNIGDMNPPNLVPSYQSDEYGEYLTRTTDDWFVYTRGVNSVPQMAIGRINARTVDEAQSVVEKIRQYETNQEFGAWRNTVTMVGDDELQKAGDPDQRDHTVDAERLAENPVLDPFNMKKIYLIEYRAVTTASVSGITKPDARRALLDQINSGSLIINYVGHGGDQIWAQERVLYAPTDMELIRNGDKQALWIAATCEFAEWDQEIEQSMAEELLNAHGRGAISLVASSRAVYSNHNYEFNKSFLEQLFAEYTETGQTKRIGEAVLLAKSNVFVNSKENSEKFLLLGDPAMRLGAPRYQAVLDEITPDSIQALRKMSISGRILKNGALWSDYQGKLQVRVKDSPKTITYYTVQQSYKIIYDKVGNTLFRGTTSVENGEFHLELIVPKDISYDGLNGQISVYFWNDETDGNGYVDGLPVGGTATDLVDREGPELELYFDEPGFTPGDYISTNPVLYVDMSDSVSGINTAGDIGHQIVMTLDDNVSSSQDLTEYFEYNEGSYVSGKLTYPIQELKEGTHTIKVKAWDNSNNSNVVESEFLVVNTDELRLTDLLNYPNPMTDHTEFSFEVSQPGMADIQVFTVAGRLVRKLGPLPVDVGYNIFPEMWDGRDQDGDKLANGVYLYKVKVNANNGDSSASAEEIGKLIIAR